MRIYELSLQLVSDTMPLVRRIGRVDRDLARQLRRSVMSVPQRGGPERKSGEVSARISVRGRGGRDESMRCIGEEGRA